MTRRQGNGGNWNAHGRRSGGYRKAVIHVPRVQPDPTVYRQCPICNRVVPPLDESCAGCRAIGKLQAEGAIE